MSSQGYTQLELAIGGTWEVREMSDFLHHLNFVYSSLCLIDYATDPNRFEFDKWFPSLLVPRPSHVEVVNIITNALIRDPSAQAFEATRRVVEVFNQLRTKFLIVTDKEARERVEKFLPPFDQLTIQAINLKSPGFITVLGRLNPLVVLKELLILLRDWKEKRREKAIENAFQELELVKKTIEVAKRANLPDEDVRQIIKSYILNPLDKLSPFARSGKIINVNTIPLDPNSPTTPAT